VPSWLDRPGCSARSAWAVAPTGAGVFDTLKAVAKLVLTELRKGG
jgi:hypothetical protein